MSSTQRGRYLAQRYRLVRPLARGAMGELWVAHDTNLDRQVAVKLIHEGLTADATMQLRFQREAQAAARLKSPHVVPVFDHGRDAGTAYIVMELLEGQSLDQSFRERGRFSLGETLWLCQQVARGLTVAHDAGVIHRDLKPGNLYITEVAGEVLVKVLDFGIARLDGFEGATTMTGELVGSPRYMSPEQATGIEALDHRSDLFSLGTILYNAVTGSYAFDGASLALVLDRVRAVDVEPPTAVDPELPPALDAFFARAMARAPDERFQSATEMAEAFARAVDLEPVALTLTSKPSSVPPPDEAETVAIGPDLPTEVMAPSGTHRGVSRPVIDLTPPPPLPWWSRAPGGAGPRVVFAAVATTATILGALGWAAFTLGESSRAETSSGPAAPAAERPSTGEPPARPAASSSPSDGRSDDLPVPEARATATGPPRTTARPGTAPGSSGAPASGGPASGGPASLESPGSNSRPASPRPEPSGGPKRLELGY